MAYQRINMTGYAVKYGLLITVACIVYFLIMRLFDLHFEAELSLLNGLIVVAGIYFTIRAFKKTKNDHQQRMEYLEGLGLGLLTSLVAGLAFGAFMVIYAIFVSDRFMEETTANEFFGKLSYFSLFGYVLVELVISGFIAGFVFMQLFKPANHKLTT